ncbi:SHOCT domain-containing protein [Ramlibacter aquaticus]|nr:SHOCT domain-containing protein [Ramlibacter aquaticus]
MWSYGGPWGGFFLMHALWWVLVIGGAVAVIRYLVRDRSAPAENALAILRERFARGEIDAAEYADRRKQLSQ